MKTPKSILTAALILSLVMMSNSDSKGMDSNVNPNLIQNVNSDNDPQSKVFKLYGSMQTQFENTTTIKFELGEDANVLLTVCDLQGLVIDTLVDDLMYAGVYNVHYKSSDKITNGEYTYKLEVKDNSGIKNVFAVK